MHQPLLPHNGDAAVDIDDDQAPKKRSCTAGPGHIAFVLGSLVTVAAVGLHYSGWEVVDLSYMDDQCFPASAIQVQGLSVDACLNRQSATQGTDCGRAAADAFCQLQKANYMVNFTLEDVPKDTKHGTITLGNSFLGGRVSFSEVCCDVGEYQPAWSRLLLLAGGVLLLYSAASVTARVALRGLEVGAAWLELEAGEVLYSLLGMEGHIRWLLFSLLLVSWVDWVLWFVWCGVGVDCEAHGSDARDLVHSLAQVLLLFTAGALFAKGAPRIISVRYLYAGEFARVRETMRNEGLLGALTMPEVREVIAARRQQQSHHQDLGQPVAELPPAAPAEGAAAPHPDQALSNTAAHPAGQSRGPSHVKSRGRSHGRSQPSADARAAAAASARKAADDANRTNTGVRDIGSILQASANVPGSAVDRFKSFLDRYSTLSEEQVAEQADAQGALLYENLVGAWDYDLDGDVGRDDFRDLFKRVGAPPGFPSANAAARAAWALFDLDQDGRLGKDEFVRALAALYRERANTARTVLSNESAVRSLETAIGGVLYTLLAFGAARIMGYTAATDGGQSTMDLFTTYVLALSFIFGDTVRSVFRSTLYLFAEQPYSVGDYLEIEDELWMVVSFDLLFTQLRKWEYNQFAKVPNDQLIDSKLVNVSRGGAFKDTIALSVPLITPTDAIREIKRKIMEAGDERPKDIVAGSPHIKVDSIDDAQTMNLMLEWVYAFPPGDRQRVDDTREYMVAACKEALCAVGISDERLLLDFRLTKASAKTKKA